MSRMLRIKSQTGVYHVMLRGIDKQQLFYDKEDYATFIKTLVESRASSDFKIYAYCLMGNHVHLLIRTIDEDIGTVIKRIGVRYVMRFNKKYDRTGHLFQDRYKSEAVDDDAYFMTVLRYILQNPVKAGLCGTAEEYAWSSVHDYFHDTGITDTAFVEQLFSEREFQEYLHSEFVENCLEEKSRRVGDKEASNIICELFDVSNPMLIQELPESELQKSIPQCRNKGVSLRQLSRLTGLSFGIVRKY